MMRSLYVVCLVIFIALEFDCPVQLKLPLFPSFEVLRDKLTVAIENNTGFGLA